MDFMELIEAKQAQTDPVKVLTPYGLGELNGTGLDASYVAFDDPDPTILKHLWLVANEDIEKAV